MISGASEKGGSCAKWNPGHYILISPFSTLPEIEQILSNPNNHIKGVQVGYLWKDLEPRKGVYDFSAIEAHLRIVKKYNKQLFVLFSDRIFQAKNKPLPPYLYDEPEYRGGAARTMNGGSVAKLWVPAVMERSNRLVEELAKRFDNEPAFEGICFEESSLAIKPNAERDYSPAAYADALVSRVDSAARAFQNSTVIVYMNWGPPELVRVIEEMGKTGVGLGGPDIIPDKGRNPDKKRNPSYDFYPKYAGKIPLGAAVQAQTIMRKTPAGNFTLEDIYDMGLNTLKLNYFFWAQYELPRYKFRFKEDILPYINSRKGEVNSACPEKKKRN